LVAIYLVTSQAAELKITDVKTEP